MELLYMDSREYARNNDEIAMWRNSHRENVRCKESIEREISENFDGFYLKDGVVETLIAAFGVDRLSWVLANTIRELAWDGRFRQQNREWAKTVPVPKDSGNCEFVVASHPEIVNGLVSMLRDYLRDRLRLVGAEACVPGSQGLDFENQLLILDPFVLSEDYKNGDFQYFCAKGGFGCHDGSLGKVFGRFLKDGEQADFRRTDFLGIADESKLPEWAKQALVDAERK